MFLLIVMTDICESMAQTCFKKGLIQTGITSVNLQNLVEFLLASASSPFVWAGILIFIVNFFLWFAVLSRIDLSVAFPIGSTSYILVPIFSMVFLNETISPMRWVAIILIIAGIHYVSQSAKTIMEEPRQ